MKKDDLIKLTEALTASGFEIISLNENYDDNELPGLYKPISIDVNVAPLPALPEQINNS